MTLPRRVRFLNFLRKAFQRPALEKWLASRTRGRSPQALISKFAPNPYQYERPSRRTFILDGIKLSADISDYLGHYYYFGFKDENSDVLVSLCKQGYTVIDVGANMGVTALMLAQRNRPGIVYAFEPDPENYKNLVRNIALNTFDNIKIFNMGLGNEAGTQQLEVRTASNRGGNRISKSNSAGYPVTVKRLDDIFSEGGIARVDLMKIDVEGYELKVLEGARGTIMEFKPALFIELDDNNLRDQGDSAVYLLRFLQQCAYTSIVRADNSTPLDEETDFANCHYDIIAQ